MNFRETKANGNLEVDHMLMVYDGLPPGYRVVIKVIGPSVFARNPGITWEDLQQYNFEPGHHIEIGNRVLSAIETEFPVEEPANDDA